MSSTTMSIGGTRHRNRRPTEQELPRLFERFHRIQGAQGRSHEGSGIGLALVQDLVKLHGGSLTVESEPSCGGIFRGRVPIGSRHLPPDNVRPARSLAATPAAANAFVEGFGLVARCLG